MSGLSRREALVWFGAMVCSVALHVGLLWHGSMAMSAEEGKAEKPAGVTRLTFSVATPTPPAPVPEAVVPPEPKPEPPPPPPKPKPVPKKTVQPKPRPAPVATPTVESPPPVASAPAPAVPTGADPQELEQARRHYLAALLAHIDRHKFYPRAARRRGMEGVIRVSFVLQHGGKVTDLQVEEGMTVLQQAARDAVQSALPLPMPPVGIALPLPISYGMEFKLN